MKKSTFVSKVCRLDSGLEPHVIPVPDDISILFREAGVTRVIVSINGYELSRGLQGGKDVESYIVVGLALLKEARVALGDSVSLEMWPDPEPDLIEVCDELMIALEQDDGAMGRWRELTKGKQRGLAYHVSSAKREETRIRRALDVAEKLRTRTLHGD